MVTETWEVCKVMKREVAAVSSKDELEPTQEKMELHKWKDYSWKKHMSSGKPFWPCALSHAYKTQ